MLKFCLILVIFQVAFGRKISSTDLHIVGGKEIDISKRPYSAVVLAYDKPICTGALISENVVLTIGKCVGQPSVYNSTYLSIRVGSSNYSTGGQLFKVEKILKHPNYTQFTNDIGIIWLNGTVSVANASPVALPKPNQIWSDGQVATVSGWGSIGIHTPKEFYTWSETLRSIDLPVQQTNCTDFFGKVDPSLFCLGTGNPQTTGPCNGDNGGPAVINKTLAGLVWMNSCVLFPDIPGNYINVAYYRDWIKANTGI